MSHTNADPELAAGATGLGVEANLAGFYAWWRLQLWSLLPGWARRLFPRQDAVIIDLRSFSNDPHAKSPATGQILIRRSGQERIAAALDLSRPSQIAREAADPVILRLPRDLVLRREVTLPAAAQGDLRSLIHFEMDRLTPFDAEEVFWGISTPIRGKDRLQLTLHVVQRKSVDRLPGLLAGIGLEPSYLEDGGDGTLLARFGKRKRRFSPRLCICAALALACLAIPLISQQLRLQATEQRLAMLMPVQRQIRQLQAQITEAAAAQNLIAQAQKNAGVVQMLALLSDALPDGTWLSDLTVNGDVVAFDGQSSDAAHLIAALAATPGFHDVSFIAPITRAAEGGPDAFSIQLSISR